MRFSCFFLCFLYLAVTDVFAQQDQTSLLTTDEIRIRDPFIYADASTQKYYMYAQMDNRLGFRGQDDKPKGVEVYISSDLKNWEQPKTVLSLPADSWARNMVWAPEVHAYKGKYYLFVTLTSSDLLEGQKAPEGAKNWPPFYKRGTQIFVSDSPLGPFKAFENKPHTPLDWMALDGTLYVEDGKPYMIFCHEWVQIADGTMDYVELADDLSRPIGKPIKMFNAASAPWANSKDRWITDGCYLYRTKRGKLIMIWSSFAEEGYAIGIITSKSGTLKGPWKHKKKRLFKSNGGHGMLFKTFEGQLMIALHQPNHPRGKERLKLFEVKDTGRSLKLKKARK